MTNTNFTYTVKPDALNALELEDHTEPIVQLPQASTKELKSIKRK